MTFISPCILPMLPVYFIYLSGASAGYEEIKAKKSSLIINSAGFVIGFTLVFIGLGASATALGHFLENHRDILRKISGIVIVAFGLYFVGLFKISFPDITKRLDLKLDKLRLPGSILFGIVFGLGWTPCLGAFLGSALALAGNSKSVKEGILLLFIYSIGLGLPFIISAVIFDKARELFRKLQTHSRLISIISGVLLIVAGVLVFTDTLKYLSL